MTEQVDLEHCEIELDKDEDLLRQIPGHQWDEQAGKPLSTAFGPSSSDQGKASYSRSSKVSPAESREWHNKFARSISVGVYKVTVEEVAAQNLRAVDDGSCPPAGAGERAPGHCFVDFRHLDKRQERIVRGLLYAHALAWGELESQSA